MSGLQGLQYVIWGMNCKLGRPLHEYPLLALVFFPSVMKPAVGLYLITIIAFL